MISKIYLILLFIILTSCVNNYQNDKNEMRNDGISVYISATDFIADDNNTKSLLSSDGTFSWKNGDRIGLFVNKIKSFSQDDFQLALALSEGDGESSAYSNATGWSLVPGDSYNYFSYYPYSELNSRDGIIIDYSAQEQVDNDSTTGVGDFDYMYSDLSYAESASYAVFSFHHIGALVNIKINVPEKYEDTTFYYMKFFADSAIFSSSAKYSVDDIVSSGAPKLDRQTCSTITLSFGDYGIKPTKGVISAWMMMLPTEWKDKAIITKLYANHPKIPTVSGIFTPESNLVAGKKQVLSVNTVETGQILPDKPVDGEQLNILLFGHSFGIDCTEYLPAITKAAGITNVHYGRLIQSDCSLARHWNNVNNNWVYESYDSDPSSGTWKRIDRTADDLLSQNDWDIIVFQQCTGFYGEGSYSSYQPYLNNLIQYVTDYCENAYGIAPIIGWNMFWGYNELKQTDYDRGEPNGALAMYNAIVTATKAMVADKTKANEINLIVPAGTAIQNARGTSLNDPGSAENPSTTKLLTRDGFHASYGIGRYVAACTWFQKIIAPIYGISIEGNTYRPTGYTPSFETDVVTDERAAICWKCAKAAVEHPYEVTPNVE